MIDHHSFLLDIFGILEKKYYLCSVEKEKNMATGTVSNIEMKRWVTESKMFTDNYPIYAHVEDKDGNIVESFNIIGCTHDGERMVLRLRKD